MCRNEIGDVQLENIIDVCWIFDSEDSNALNVEMKRQIETPNLLNVEKNHRNETSNSLNVKIKLATILESDEENVGGKEIKILKIFFKKQKKLGGDFFIESEGSIENILPLLAF